MNGSFDTGKLYKCITQKQKKCIVEHHSELH